ncbi:MAG: ribosome silencing factor [Actinomycetota bacterium]
MTYRGDPSDTRELALAAAAIAYEKKAEDIVLLDMRGLVDYTDFLVICTGRTPRQTKAISEEIRHRLKNDLGVPPRRVEGEKEGDWILIDALDVVVHVFTPEARDFYRLDRLWREAPLEQFAPSPA